MLTPWIIAFQINHAVVSFWADRLQAITGKPLDTSFDWAGLMAGLGDPETISDASDKWDGRVRETRRSR